MKNVKKVLKIGFVTFLILILIIDITILIKLVINKEGKIPSFFGWKPFIVLSGSMEPTIKPGDLAFVKEENSFKLDDIIAFKTENNTVITHRIVEIVENEDEVLYKTKGDSNNKEDSDYVSVEQIEGVFKFKISKLGYFAMVAQDNTGMFVLLAMPLALLLLVREDKDGE